MGRWWGPPTLSMRPVDSVSLSRCQVCRRCLGSRQCMEGTVGTQPLPDREHMSEDACCFLESGLILALVFLLLQKHDLKDHHLMD